MIDLNDSPRRIAGSRLFDILAERGVTSLVDPFMGVPMHLNFLKRHGIAVHGGDVIDWFVRVGEGIVVNDFTILRDSEVGEIVEVLPARIYPIDMFKAWEGVFFSEEQCVYLGVWHANVHNLRSDGQTGLAILGLWFVLCYWLQKAQKPDEMPDIPPSELAWHYIRATERWVTQNSRRNTVRRGDYLATLAANPNVDALFFAPPRRNALLKPDSRIWMWEAWWQGDPYLNIERYYRDTAFGSRMNDEGTYDRALAGVLTAASDIPTIVVQTEAKDASRFERLLAATGRNLETVAASLDEMYLIAKR
jgi:hypothetical protein